MKDYILILFLIDVAGIVLFLVQLSKEVRSRIAGGFFLKFSNYNEKKYQRSVIRWKQYYNVNTWKKYRLERFLKSYDSSELINMIPVGYYGTRRIGKSINIMLKIEEAFIENKESKTFEESILETKTKNNCITIIGIMLAVLIYNSLYFIFGINLKTEIFLVLTIMICMIVLHQTVITYRIKRGVYGSNYGEAKELLYYIKEYSKNNKDINKGKKIFNEVNECQLEKSGQVEYV